MFIHHLCRLSNHCRDMFTQMGSGYMQDLRYRDVWFFIGALTPNTTLSHAAPANDDLDLDALGVNESSTTDYGFTPFEEVSRFSLILELSVMGVSYECGCSVQLSYAGSDPSVWPRPISRYICLPRARPSEPLLSKSLVPLEKVPEEMKSEAHRAFCASYAASDDVSDLFGYSDFCNGIMAATLLYSYTIIILMNNAIHC